MDNSLINDGGIPSVYKRFQSERPLTDGSRPWYVIKILTPDRWDEALSIYVDQFIYEEPICKCGNLGSCPESLDGFKTYWKNILSGNAVLVCYLDDDSQTATEAQPKIVGMNMTYVQQKNDQEPTCSGPVWLKLLNSLHILSDQGNVYKKYNVNSYLSALGLYTLPEYRRQGIGKELLLARIPLCRSLGIRLTVTVFTATASQALAEKCGFQLLVEIPYAEFEAVHGIRYPGIKTKSMKLMALEIN